MNKRELRATVRQMAERLAVPGVAVGIYHAGKEQYAFHGVTSVENPLPVDESTLFQIGSVTKTFTGTAIMRLLEEERVDLDAPVRQYIPELQLRNETAAAKVTVLQLLNHTAGWAGDLIVNTGDGDDALAEYVKRMANLEQLAQPGSSCSYNNAAFALAGRVIEKVTGLPYEQAIRELLFEPLGLHHCFFFPNEIMTRRFAAGHRQAPDGSIAVARPWALPRAGTANGGITANAGDLIAWAKFHLGDGRAADGTRVLKRDLLQRMREPTVDVRGSALGDYVGLAWMLTDIGGVHIVSHDGGTNGQNADLVMVPERDWAIAVLNNCVPTGVELCQEIARWGLKSSLGISEPVPEPLSLAATELEGYAGHYESIGLLCEVSAKRDGGLVMTASYTPQLAEQMREAGEEASDQAQVFSAVMLSGTGDRYLVTEGPLKGLKGYFGRATDGTVDSIHLGGRRLHRALKEPTRS